MTVYRRRRNRPFVLAFNNAAAYFSDDAGTSAYYFDDAITLRYVTS